MIKQKGSNDEITVPKKRIPLLERRLYETVWAKFCRIYKVLIYRSFAF